MAKASELIAKAVSQRGYTEGPNNGTKYGVWYAAQVHDQQFAHAAWCDEFLSWCGAQVGAGSIVGRFAYTPAHAAWFKSHGRWGSVPRIGALVFFDWGGSHSISAIDHVGLVTKVRSDGRIQTVEGNTDNQVAERVRDLSNVAGFGYPAYASATPAAPGKPPAGKPRYPGHLIQRGSTGEDVKRVQRKVGVSDDGVFGPDTQRATKSWQLAHHLDDDGRVGPLTWRAMFG